MTLLVHKYSYGRPSPFAEHFQVDLVYRFFLFTSRSVSLSYGYTVGIRWVYGEDSLFQDLIVAQKVGLGHLSGRGVN